MTTDFLNPRQEWSEKTLNNQTIEIKASLYLNQDKRSDNDIVSACKKIFQAREKVKILQSEIPILDIDYIKWCKSSFIPFKDNSKEIVLNSNLDNQSGYIRIINGTEEIQIEIQIYLNSKGQGYKQENDFFIIANLICEHISYNAPDIAFLESKIPVLVKNPFKR